MIDTGDSLYKSYINIYINRKFQHMNDYRFSFVKWTYFWFPYYRADTFHQRRHFLSKFIHVQHRSQQISCYYGNNTMQDWVSLYKPGRRLTDKTTVRAAVIKENKKTNKQIKPDIDTFRPIRFEDSAVLWYKLHHSKRNTCTMCFSAASHGSQRRRYYHNRSL